MTAALEAAWRALGHFNRVLLFVCRYLLIALVASIAAIICIGVFWRYVLGSSLGWYEEISKFLMVWMAFIGGGLVFRHGGHVSIDLLPNMLPARPRALLAIVTELIVLVLLAVLTDQSWALTWNARSQVALTVGDLSLLWIYLAVPVGCGIMFCIALEMLLGSLLQLLAPAGSIRTAAVEPVQVLASE